MVINQAETSANIAKMGKLLYVLLIGVIVSQGTALTEITLPDQSTTFVTNDLIPKTIGIAKHFLDTLVSCQVIFPDRNVYEAFPNNNIPTGRGIYFLEAVQPFTSCSIGFRGVDISRSGTYELISLVHHVSDSSRSLTRQRFHLTFIESGPWKADV